jgi:D-amino-acid dehydrogenase
MRAVVIGAGLLGISSAFFLRRAGVEVIIVDRADGPGRETSFANGGLLTPSMADPWNAPGILRKMLRWIGHEDAPVLLRPRALASLGAWGIDFVRQSAPGRFRRNLLRNVRLANYTLDLMADLRSEYDLDYDGASTGSLKLLRDQGSLREAVAMAEAIEPHGVAFESLDRAQTVAREPALSPIAERIAGSVYFPSDEIGDAHKFCCEIARVLRQQGARFLFGEEMRGLRVERGRVMEVLTDKNVLVADVYVMAAGSNSARLLRPYGLRLPVRPAKGYSITVPLGDWSPPPVIPVVDDALHAVVVPLGDRIRVAGTAELAGFDCRIRPERIENLHGLLQQTYPEFAAKLDPAQIRPWAGLRPMSSDGVPLIGPTRLDNLYLNTGHGHLGWTLAAGSGRALADLITHGQPQLDMTDYSPARFGRDRG